MSYEQAGKGTSGIEQLIAFARSDRRQLNAFMLAYTAGIEEISTKLIILQREFKHASAYNPIEHVRSRLKDMDSLLGKAQRKGCHPSLEGVSAQITDIAGVRVVCSFVSDVYRIKDLLCSQQDLRVLTVKDYIAEPKDNGYRSLHVIIEVPVFLSTQIVRVPVEVQFRTIAMDFWASLEHKIYYRYAEHVPQSLLDKLRDAALTAAALDAEMEGLHHEIRGADRRASLGLTSGGDLAEHSVAEFLRGLPDQVHRDEPVASTAALAAATDLVEDVFVTEDVFVAEEIYLSRATDEAQQDLREPIRRGH